MFLRLFLVTALWSRCAASETSVSRKILTSAGEAVVLPCIINITSDDIPAVEWSKEGPDSSIAFLYRDGCETYEMKSAAFQYRTNLFMNKLSNGNLSMRISNAQLSDAGQYTCKTLQRPHRQVCTVELVVDAVSEPKLSFVPSVDGGVSLQCEASCWFPEPELTFLNEQGNDISAENPKSYRDSSGCFTVTRRVTLHAATTRLTCRVHQAAMNQTRVTHIYIPDVCMGSCVPGISGAVVVTALLCGLIAFLWKKFGNSVRGQKWQVPGLSCHQRKQADGTPEHLSKSKLSLNDKEKKIRQTTDRPTSQQRHVASQHGQPTTHKSPSKPSPVTGAISQPPHRVPHHNYPQPAASTTSNHPQPGKLPQSRDSSHIPAPGSQIQRSSYNPSSPAPPPNISAVSPTSPVAVVPGNSHVGRSMSLSEPRRNAIRSPRRYTTSAHLNNPFEILANLPEDSEHLLG